MGKSLGKMVDGNRNPLQFTGGKLIMPYASTNNVNLPFCERAFYKFCFDGEARKEYIHKAIDKIKYFCYFKIR